MRREWPNSKWPRVGINWVVHPLRPRNFPRPLKSLGPWEMYQYTAKILRGGMYWKIHPPPDYPRAIWRAMGCKIAPGESLKVRGGCISQCIPTQSSVRSFSHREIEEILSLGQYFPIHSQGSVLKNMIFEDHII